MSDVHAEDRRATDTTQADIRGLILNMDDAKDKAMLLILLRMAENLEKTAEKTDDLLTRVESQGKSFDLHEGNEKILLGKASMAWYVLSGVIVFALGIAGIWIRGVADDYKDLGLMVAQHSISLTVQRKDIDLLQEHERITESVQRGLK